MSVPVTFLTFCVLSNMAAVAHGLQHGSLSQDSSGTLGDMGSILQDSPVELAPDMEKIGGSNLMLLWSLVPL